MQFANDTPLPAAILPSSESRDRIRAVVIASITYRIDDMREHGLELVEA
jgi:hypothetical protein